MLGPSLINYYGPTKCSLGQDSINPFKSIQELFLKMQKTVINRSFETTIKPSTPGILLFDQKNKLVYINPKAQSILPDFTQSYRSEQSKNRAIPNIVHKFCDRLKSPTPKTDNPRTNIPPVRMATYVLREVPLKNRQRTKIRKTEFLMVIVEESSNLREMSLKKSKKFNN